jgi:2-hydroxy-3-oxopropionate reductase
LQSGKELNLSLPGTECMAGQMKAAMDQGNGELDHSALFLTMKK